MSLSSQQEPAPKHQSRSHTPIPQGRKGDIPLEQLSITMSWGERLLPYFYIAMESCWIYAIFLVLAHGNFFQSTVPLLPMWGLFLLFAGSYFFSLLIDRRQYRRALAASGGRKTQVEARGTLWIFGVIASLALFVTWGSLYVDHYLLFDPRWVGALFTDLLLLTPSGYRILVIWALAGYFCWRGLRLSQRPIEPGDILGRLRIGIVVIIAALLLTFSAESQVQGSLLRLLLIPLFLTLALIAHALARAISMRHAHPVGLQGGAVAQERSLFLLIGGVGIGLFLLALVLGLFISPAFLKDFQQELTPLGITYDWLVSMLAHLVVFILTPLFWLVSLFHFSPVPEKIPPTPPTGLTGLPHSTPPASILLAASVLKIVLPLLALAIIGLAIFLLVTRRRRFVLQHRALEMHESLWSWQLFRTQLITFFLAIWRRLFGKKQQDKTLPLVEEPLSGPPALRSIREIYRALLKWAAQHSLPRKRFETPAEFQQRLLDKFPQTGQEVQTLTTAYTAIRYGGIVPDDAELQQVEQSWSALQQKL